MDLIKHGISVIPLYITAFTTVLSTIGWMSMPAYIAYRKLLFLWSILCLPVNNIYRRIVVAILVSCDVFGPVKLSPIGDSF